ncbi:hypothetical protein V7075_25685 [Neobacillus drentensis]|uniref:hypothetical protein n=1 Tax=Neobacillus drentensis TaxID=220684 RepID=UPI002FFFC2FA
MKTFINRSFIGIFFGCFIAVLVTNLFILFGGFEMIDGPLFLKRIKLACVEIIKLETTKKLEFNIQQLIDREK